MQQAQQVPQINNWVASLPAYFDEYYAQKNFSSQYPQQQQPNSLNLPHAIAPQTIANVNITTTANP